MDGDVIAEEFGLGGGEEKGRERKSQAHRARGTVPVSPTLALCPQVPLASPCPSPPATSSPRELVPPFPSPVSREIQMFGPSSGIAQPCCPARCFLSPWEGVCAPRLGTPRRGMVFPPCQHLRKGFSHIPSNTCRTGGLLTPACPRLPWGAAACLWGCSASPPARSDAGCRDVAGHEDIGVIWGIAGESLRQHPGRLWLCWGCPSSSWEMAGGWRGGRLGGGVGGAGTARLRARRQWVSTAGLQPFIPAGSRERSGRSRAMQTISRCTAGRSWGGGGQ